MSPCSWFLTSLRNPKRKPWVLFPQEGRLYANRTTVVSVLLATFCGKDFSYCIHIVISVQSSKSKPYIGKLLCLALSLGRLAGGIIYFPLAFHTPNLVYLTPYCN